MSDTNQIIHERLMGGGCYHKENLASQSDVDFYAHGGKFRCRYCKKYFSRKERDGLPKYDSNLNDTFAAQAQAVKRFGASAYCFALIKVVYDKDRLYQADAKLVNGLIASSAKQRCAAIVKLLENEK